MAIHFSLKKEIGRFPPNSANKSEQNQSRENSHSYFSTDAMGKIIVW